MMYILLYIDRKIELLKCHKYFIRLLQLLVKTE